MFLTTLNNFFPQARNMLENMPENQNIFNIQNSL